jgi:hypothetical protein
MILKPPVLEDAALWMCTAVGAAVKLAMVLLIGTAAPAWAQGESTICPMGTTFGDYLKDKDKVAMSERYHFTPKVEALIAGESTQLVASDLHFMLQNYPNHHRVLVAMVRLGEKEKTPQPRGAPFTIDCYFDRAIRFRRDDVVARMLYANYLAKNSRQADARSQLEAASLLAADNPFTQYNIGLIYLEMKDYDKALAHAHEAYALGFPRSELRDQLKQAGRWKEPDPAAVAPDAVSSTAAAPASAASAAD